MTPDTPAESEFVLRGEHITLDALLKATGFASSGGAAKQLIAEGHVSVNGSVETRRGAKLRAGQRVVCVDQATAIRLVAAGHTADGSTPRGDEAEPST